MQDHLLYSCQNYASSFLHCVHHCRYKNAQGHWLLSHFTTSLPAPHPHPTHDLEHPLGQTSTFTMFKWSVKSITPHSWTFHTPHPHTQTFSLPKGDALNQYVLQFKKHNFHALACLKLNNLNQHAPFEKPMCLGQVSGWTLNMYALISIVNWPVPERPAMML